MKLKVTLWLEKESQRQREKGKEGRDREENEEGKRKRIKGEKAGRKTQALACTYTHTKQKRWLQAFYSPSSAR